MTTHQTWQNNLDPKLIQRLIRPVVQPGVIGTQMARMIISRSQNFSNRLPLLSQIAQRQTSVAGFQAEQTPIVYAQMLPRETKTAVSTPVQTNQPSKPTVVQAKFASPPASTSLGDTAKKLVSPTLQNSTNSNPLSPLILQNPIPNLENLQTGNRPIVYAQPLREKPNSNKNNLLQADTQKDRVGVSEPTVIQAKFASPTESPSLTLALPENLTASSESFPSEQMPIVYPKSQQSNLNESIEVAESLPLVYAQPLLDEVSDSGNFDSSLIRASENNLLNNQSPNSLTSEITNPINTSSSAVSPVWLNNSQLPTQESLAKITSKIPRSVVQETQTSRADINTPLVFSPPNALAARGLGNQETTDISRTPAINRNIAPTIPSGITANSTNLAASNFPTTANNQTLNYKNEKQVQKIDIDALADKVERKLMRKLIIENERRGRTTWS